MKAIYVLLMAIFMVFTAHAKENQLLVSKEKVEFIISEDTTEAQLKKFKKRLKEEANIDFNFQGIIVNAKKKLSEVTIEVDSNDGVHGSGKLLVSAIYEVGFVRDYQVAAPGDAEKQPLLIGNIREKAVILE